MAVVLPERISTNAVESRLLEEAFQHFNQASQRLEQQYGTLLKETEALRAEIAEKDREIRRSERLATLGETAAGIAHEIRNPLGAIRLFASLLKDDLADRPESLGLVLQIEQSVSSLDGVVSNILQFAKKDGTAVHSPVNFHSLIREQVEQFRSCETCNAEIEVALQGNPFIQGNHQGLRQVLYNLLLNSLQATSHSGKISVVCSDDSSDRLRLELSDNGPGIDQEIIETIFEPFVSNKNEGTGLGLAIVKRIIEQHGASIDVCNKVGAHFTVVFKRNGQAASDSDNWV